MFHVAQGNTQRLETRLERQLPAKAVLVSVVVLAVMNPQYKISRLWVIEVGVDVPNASLMIIENAERLGLAQLHQLRGRIGRGAEQSNCVLMYNPPLGGLAKQRMQIMRETSDGFRIAEKDLELRGPGEVLGTRQTGAMMFRVADLARDASLLHYIPGLADRLLANHPQQTDKLIRRWVGSASRFAGV